jgi:hypothetical protein
MLVEEIGDRIDEPRLRMMSLPNNLTGHGMSIEEQLRDKLEKVEALYFGAGTAGEKNAAEAAIERLRAKLAENSQQDPPEEMQFSMPDPWPFGCSSPCVAAMGCDPIDIPGRGGRRSWCGRREGSLRRWSGVSFPTCTRIFGRILKMRPTA